MLNLLLLAICFCDGVLIFQLLKSVLIAALGDSKSFRMLKIFALFPCGVGYTMFALHTGLVASDVSFLFGLCVIFGPVAIVGIISILAYIRQGK